MSYFSAYFSIFTTPRKARMHIPIKQMRKLRLKGRNQLPGIIQQSQYWNYDSDTVYGVPTVNPFLLPM